VVLELHGNTLSTEELSHETAVWHTMPGLPAVRNGRVYLLGDARTVIPGPRVADAIDLIARTLHADAFK